MKQTRYMYVDLLKVIAMVLVVVIHLCTPGWKAGGDTLGWQALNLYDALAHVAVPLFLMTSGAMLLSPARALTPKTALTKYAVRVALAFVAWSAVYAAVGYLSGALTLTGAVKQLVTGEYHMWYLFIIAMLYAVTPLLQKLTGDRRLLGYFLALSLVFTVLLPAVGRYVGAVDTLTGYFYMQLPVGYTLYFCAGYYLHTYGLPRAARIVLYVLGVSGAAATVLCAARTQDAWWFDAFAPGVCAATLAVYTAVQQLCRGRASGRALSALGSATLGVYLAHELALKVLAALGRMPDAATAVWAVPVWAVTVSAMCFALSVLVRRVRFLRYFF